MKCKCGKKAVIFRKYEGVYLCKTCFCNSIEKKVKRTVRQNKMIEPDDRIAFGLSGGKDSSAVLHLMHKIISPRKDMEFFAFTIDEGIKGYREHSIKIAKDLCKRLGVEHRVYTYKEMFGNTLDQKLKNVKKDDIQTTCSYCGVARRYALNKISRDLKATKLCVGHNLDDETQSILMNYMRGDMAKASRLGAITNYSTNKKGGGSFVPRIKPLREIPEKETALYAILNGLEVQEDECPYASGIRFTVRDFLNKMESSHPGMKFSVLETFDRLLPIMRSFIETQNMKIRLCKNCGEPSSEEVCNLCKMWS